MPELSLSFYGSFRRSVVLAGCCSSWWLYRADAMQVHMVHAHDFVLAAAGGGRGDHRMLQ